MKKPSFNLINSIILLTANVLIGIIIYGLCMATTIIDSCLALLYLIFLIITYYKIDKVKIESKHIRRFTISAYIISLFALLLGLALAILFVVLFGPHLVTPPPQSQSTGNQSGLAISCIVFIAIVVTLFVYVCLDFAKFVKKQKEK